MYKRGDKEYFFDIYNVCMRILKYTKGISRSEFMENEEKQDAVVRNLEILGESVKNVSENFKKKYPEVQWKEIAKTRDKLIPISVSSKKSLNHGMKSQGRLASLEF